MTGLRQRVFALLDDEPSEPVAGRSLTRTILIAAIILSVAASIIGTMRALEVRMLSLLAVIELVAVIIFTIEYAARVWTAVDDRDGRYEHPLWGRLRFAITPMALIDLMAVLPFYLGLFFNLDLLVLKLFRLLRILKITRYSRALTTFEIVLYNERRALGSALLIVVVLLIVASTLLYSIEKDVQPEAMGSVPAAMWWAVITLTTVGYGDVSPVTPLGKVVAGVLAVLGIGMFAIPTAILGSGFAHELQKRNFIDLATMVARAPAFKDLPPRLLAEITALLRPRELPPRYVITRPGEISDAVYFVAEGRVSFRGPNGRRTIGKGEVFGDLAVLKGNSQAVGATTLTHCTILELNSHDFLRLIDGDPALQEALRKNS